MPVHFELRHNGALQSLSHCCCCCCCRCWCCRLLCCRWFFQQLILAVDYCHSKGVANRDIKLENTLLAVRHRIRCWYCCMSDKMPCDGRMIRPDESRMKV